MNPSLRGRVPTAQWRSLFGCMKRKYPPPRPRLLPPPRNQSMLPEHAPPPFHPPRPANAALRQGVRHMTYCPEYRLIVSGGFCYNLAVNNPYVSSPISRLRGHSAPIVGVEHLVGTSQASGERGEGWWGAAEEALPVQRSHLSTNEFFIRAV